MGFKITGLENLQRKLSDISRKAEALNGQHSVAISEIITPQFLARCSRFISITDMFEQSKFKIDSQEDFAAVPDDEWDVFIQENTTYKSWQDMKSAGAAEWAKAKIGL